MRHVPSRRALLRLLVLAILVGGTTACIEDPFSPYWDRGTYDLRWANNRPVPATVSGGYSPIAPRTDVMRGSLTLRRDHSYQLLVDVREYDARGQWYESTRVFAGHYEHDGSTIYMSYFMRGDYYSSAMVANWRGGRVEVVVPEVDGRSGVLCVFE